jgi:tellurite resistance protein
VVFLGFGFHFRVTGRGTLHCQRCGGDREYRMCAGWRWLHVLFIPVVPMDRIVEHVQCTTCGTRYRVEVLAMPTAAQMRTALPAGTRAAVTAMLRAAGDDSSPAARAGAIDAVRLAGLADYDDAAVTADLARDEEDAAAELRDLLGTLALQLIMPAHEWFLADIVRVGLADGQLSDAERAAARRIAACLGLTPAQAHGVIWLTEESASAG